MEKEKKTEKNKERGGKASEMKVGRSAPQLSVCAVQRVVERSIIARTTMNHDHHRTIPWWSHSSDSVCDRQICDRVAVRRRRQRRVHRILSVTTVACALVGEELGVMFTMHEIVGTWRQRHRGRSSW